MLLTLGVATVAPYMLMEKRTQSAEKSILLTQPTNAFYGVYTAVRQCNVLLFVTAFTTVASEFLPILLSNIPYALTQTEETHVVCTYVSLAIMAVMVLVLAVSMFIRWPHMPVDPRTLAGAAYYVADSATLLRDVIDCGPLTLDRRQRAKHLADLDRRYFYGRVVSPSGRTRMAIDGVDHERQ